MNCFTKVLALLPVVFGLSMAGTGVTTIEWGSPAGVVAGPVVEVVIDALGSAPLAAQHRDESAREAGGSGALAELDCEWCVEGKMTCSALWQEQGGNPTGAWWAHCSGQDLETEIPVHAFDLASSACEGGGGPDPDFTLLGMGGGEDRCAACGGTSDCHSTFDAGHCHLECAGGGPDPELANALDAALTAGDIALGIQLVAAHQRSLRVLVVGEMLQVVSACSGGPVLTQVAVDSPFGSALTASGATKTVE